MPYPRPQVPTYPRPVSPLHAEPIPILPGEIVYDSSSDSAKSLDPKDRAAKLRRIEQWGHRYLRGEDVFIMSAGLKGPLSAGTWKNPWAEHTNSHTGVEMEVPETVRRSGLQILAAPKVPRDRRNQADPFASRAGNASLPRKPKSSKVRPTRQTLDLTKNDPTMFTRPKDQRVQDWLKISKTYHEDIESNRATSPTPTRPVMKPKRQSLHTVPPSTHLPAFEYRRVSREAETDNNKEEPPRAAQSSLNADTQEDTSVSTPVHHDPFRGQQPAEHFSITVPKTLTTEHGKANKSYIDQPPKIVPPPSPHHPSLSMDTSDATNIPPSAQIVPAQELLPAIKIPSNDDQILEEPTLNEAKKKPTPQKALGPSSPPQQQVNTLDTQQMLAAMTPLAFSTVRKVPSKGAQLEKLSPVTATKRKAPAGEVAKPRKAVKRTSFAPDMHSLFSGSSQSSLKTSLKVSKGPSFLTTEILAKSSNKMVPPPHFETVNLDMDTSDDDGEPAGFGQFSGEHGVASHSLPGVSSILGGTGKTKQQESTLKSVPKSSNHQPAPSTAKFLAQSSPSRNSTAAPTSTTSGLQQDAQPQAHHVPFALGSDINDDQNGLSSICAPAGVPKEDGDADFDLQGAIDDLGSYLGTWDADKEASGLATMD